MGKNCTPKNFQSIRRPMPSNESNYTVIELMIVQWMVKQWLFQLDEIPFGNAFISLASCLIIFHTISHILRAINRAKCLFLIRQYFSSSQFSEFQVLPHFFTRIAFFTAFKLSVDYIAIKRIYDFPQNKRQLFSLRYDSSPPMFSSIPFHSFFSAAIFCFTALRPIVVNGVFFFFYYQMQWLILEIASTDAIFLWFFFFRDQYQSNRNPNEKWL